MKTLKPTARPEHPAVADPKALGKFVRAARTAAGLTIEQAADLIGIHKDTLSNLENGKGTVGISIVFRVMNELGLAMLVAQKPEAEALVSILISAKLSDPQPPARGTP